MSTISKRLYRLAPGSPKGTISGDQILTVVRCRSWPLSPSIRCCGLPPFYRSPEVEDARVFETGSRLK
jgi:hypothetical protein